jgi:hypothetical protein
MKISFYCDINLPNYLDNPSEYKYLHGRHSSTGYYYWILKNYGLDVHLNHPNPDVVIFHYDNKDYINNLSCKKIQVVTDRPIVEGCDYYIAANQSFFNKINDINVIRRYGIENTLNTWVQNKKKWRFVHYPPTFGVKECAPLFRPINFKFVGRRHTNIKELYDPIFMDNCKKLGINLTFDFENDANDGTEDVYFCIRNVIDSCKVTKLNNNSGKYGHRTANRLYQAWKMRTPAIFNNSPEMAAIRTSEYDFLIANNTGEFIQQALRLKSDKNLFDNMISHAIMMDKINPYVNMTIVVDQWKEIFKELCQQ